MDEMAIRQDVQWDGINYHWFIDMGTDLDGVCLPVTKEALTFMVEAHKSSLKVPIGYFLIDGLISTERSKLVLQALDKLHSVGSHIVSLTFDGATSNLGMSKILGYDLDPNNLRSCLNHPSTRRPVCVFLDPCYIFKLIKKITRGFRYIFRWTGEQNYMTFPRKTSSTTRK